MWDVILVILVFNANWWIDFKYIAFTGFPLTLMLFYAIWYWNYFPTSMYRTDGISMFDVGILLGLTDALQTFLHYGAHTFLKHTFFGKAHMIHHLYRDPVPQDAFFTGFADAVLQLILPIWLILTIVQPTKWTAAMFGCVYSWWLLFIHSDSRREYHWLEYMRIVTPKHHHKHHHNPRTNFSNIFVF